MITLTEIYEHVHDEITHEEWKSLKGFQWESEAGFDILNEVLVPSKERRDRTYSVPELLECG